MQFREPKERASGRYGVIRKVSQAPQAQPAKDKEQATRTASNAMRSVCDKLDNPEVVNWEVTFATWDKAYEPMEFVGANDRALDAAVVLGIKLMKRTPTLSAIGPARCRQISANGIGKGRGHPSADN